MYDDRKRYAFITENYLEDCEYEAWAFGAEADLLAHLVVIGEKTATADMNVVCEEFAVVFNE